MENEIPQNINEVISLMSKCYSIQTVNDNKCWSHIAPFSRLYLVKLKVVVQLKSHSK